MVNLKDIDKTWTLFLDRDGVVNYEKLGDYINTWEEFKFIPGAKEAIKKFSERFGHVFIITNQRGVAKGVTKLENLHVIHKNLIDEVAHAGGKISHIYYCCDLDDSSINRKPNPGMGLQAKKDFPEVDFTKSIMIGNTIGDMEFGRNLGVALNIFIRSAHPFLGVQHEKVDMVFPDLASVAKAL